jgi:hypothetical protein
MNADLILTSQTYLEQNPISQFRSHKAASNLFNQALRDGVAHRLWGRLSGHSTALRTLTHTPVAQQGARRRQIAFIPMEWIVGSESRSDDFDNHFNPLKAHLLQRWVGIAIAHRKGVALPPVELIRDGNQYYVRDGHHRISVAKMVGQLEIEAVIVN